MLLAFAIMLVSFKAVNLIARKIEKKSNDGKHDKTIMRTVAYLFRLGVKILIIICLIGFVGIDTSGLTAMVVSFGAAIGLAVNGTLSNLAGGVLIILTRPFRVDDFIEAQGYSGTVEEIHVTNTKLLTPDNKVVYLPNGALANGNIVNFSEKDTRRVDLVFRVSHSDDFERAKDIVMNAVRLHSLVLADPPPFVKVTAQGSSSIDITARVWVKSGDYWTVNFDLIEAVKHAFEENGIEIPFDRLDVRIRQ